MCHCLINLSVDKIFIIHPPIMSKQGV